VPFSALSTDPEVVRHIGRGRVWDEAQTRTFIDKQIRHQATHGFSRYKLTLRETGELVGFCGIDYFGTTGELEIGWWIKRALWGRGLATEAAGAVKDYLTGTLGIPAMISVCTPENRASMRIMTKIGLVFRERTQASALGLPYRDLEVMVYATP